MANQMNQKDIDFDRLLVREMTRYIGDKKSQDECVGFYDGFKRAYEIFKDND